MTFLAMLLQEQPSVSAVHHILATILPIMGVLVVFALLIILVPYWFICKKAGLSPWLTFLNIIPFGNLILIYYLAFAQWKVVPAPSQIPPQA